MIAKDVLVELQETDIYEGIIRRIKEITEKENLKHKHFSIPITSCLSFLHLFAIQMHL